MPGSIFTPQIGHTGRRADLTLSPTDDAKILRGRRWHATVTDLMTGRRWHATGASCGIAGCYCDARARPVSWRKRFVLHTEDDRWRYLECEDWRPPPGDLDFATLRRIAEMLPGEELALGGGASTRSVLYRKR